MPTLNDAAATELLEQLEGLLAVAGGAFTDGASFRFPPELNRIPVIVECLQPFLGRATAVRTPFWNCVKALDERRAKLTSISTLEEMVDRATSMESSPMVVLLQAEEQGRLSAQEQSVLAALHVHLQSGPEDPPANLKECRSLFARVPSPAYEKLLKGLPRAMLSEQFERIMDYTAYVDFRLRNQLWNERYLTTLTDDLYGFLLWFDHDLFYEQLNRVLHGRTPKAVEVKAGHARYLAKERQRDKRRKTKPRSSLPPPGPGT